ncbi:MAG: ABC transporter substrate-binding protein [Thermodesulfovibrionales bacterium]|nr:ABC transporter substrate-binding protein [Thermodesulfovibrionales bacterium]
MSKKLFYVLFITATILVFSMSVSIASEVVKIGALYPMTGRAGLYGKDSEAAIKIALDEVNAKGIAKGKYKLDVIITEDQSKPDYAVSVAKRYITSDKVKFLFGVISSAVGLAVTEVSKEYKVIFIGTDHAATDLTAHKFQKYYFRVSNNTYQSMYAGAMYLKDMPNWKKIAYIGPDYAYGRDQWLELKYGLDKLGVKYEVVGEYWPKLYEPDYTSYITAILRAKPDILVTGFWGGDTVAFIKQAKAYGLFDKMKYFHPDAGGNYELFAAMGDELPDGLILSARHHNNWPPTKENKAFVDKFFKATGRYPSYAAQGAYAGIHFIAQAIEKVGNPNDTEALVKALEGMKLKLPEDPEGFTSYIDPKTHQIVQVQAIGVTEKNDKFPPAKKMLGNFKVYPADKLLPTDEYVEILRKSKK